MNHKTVFTNLAVAIAVGGFMFAPMNAEAQGRGNKNGHNKGHSNSAPPKKNGRHDNRDWNKGRDNDWNRRGNDDWNRRNDDWRNRNEWERREAERRRAEEQRRAEQRRWEEQRQRDEWNRRNDSRRNDDWRNDGGWRESDRRQETKNEWRNIALASGAVALLGLLNNDSTLTFAGVAGALYSTHRYEQDRKSQNSVNRLRASYFSRDHFYRDGHRYTRKTINRNGQSYYQFCRD